MSAEMERMRKILAIAKEYALVVMPFFASFLGAFLIPGRQVSYFFGFFYFTKFRENFLIKRWVNIGSVIAGNFLGIIAHYIFIEKFFLSMSFFVAEVLGMSIWCLWVYPWKQKEANAVLASSELVAEKIVETPAHIPTEPETKNPVIEPVKQVAPVAAAVPAALNNGTNANSAILRNWGTLIRNAKDGGANSVLASYVLRKTGELLANGNDQVEHMLHSAAVVSKNTRELEQISEEIHDLAQGLRIMAVNLSLEASRAGGNSQTIKVVASAMRDLAEQANNFSKDIDKKLKDVSQKTTDSEFLCKKVAVIFSNINIELEQFKSLMLRIEQLAVVQGSQLNTVEDQLRTGS